MAARDLIARNGDARSRQGGRHRQTRRWSTPARIVGCGDASSRSVATAGDWCHRRQWRCCSSTCAARSSRHRRMRRCSSEAKNRLGVSEAASLHAVQGGRNRAGDQEETARPDVQLGHFSRIFRLIRCERPAVGAARSAVAFSRRASAPGAAARRAALLQS